MSKVLYNSSGGPIKLGKQLGRGGEGSVFDTGSESNDVVAKVYHAAIPIEKQAKLAAMALVGDSYLRKISAWPSELLRSSQNGPVVGFLMPKVTGYEPIHHLYSPAHRKQTFPKATFDLLLGAARNVAAAFSAIHAHGHVVGDVNQGNVVVAANGTVKLIDCDSFQITASGADYLCEVGVLHFTAPELQGLKSFHGLKRNANHDNFGLSVLIFHLLFMGRHPYSGQFQGKGDMPLERAIAEYRFAYGPNNRSRMMQTPPSAPPLELVPSNVRDMFELAFTNSPSSRQRPSASEWVTAIDALLATVKICNREKHHKYLGHLNSCPWCYIQASGTAFFVPPFVGHTFATAIAGATWQDVWLQIKAITIPPLPAYAAPSTSVSPAPLPQNPTKTYGPFTAPMWFVVFGAFAATFAIPALWFIWLCIGLGIVRYLDVSDPLHQVRERRSMALKNATNNFSVQLKRYQAQTDTDRFTTKRSELERLKVSLEGLSGRFQSERQKLRDSMKARQLERFLSQFYISQADIPGIGPGRKATLASFGIETAADVSTSRVQRVRGFGTGLTADLMAWKRSLENRFVFNTNQPIDPQDEQALISRFNAEKASLEASLRSGFGLLQQIANEILGGRHSVKSDIDTAAAMLAQAKADIAIFTKP